MEALFISLNVRGVSSKKNLTTLRVLHGFTDTSRSPPLNILLLGVKNVKSVSRIWGQNNSNKGREN